jgi:carbonic anhydrase/acetyltransferase-like protein (isoleucine patch superfamily)
LIGQGSVIQEGAVVERNSIVAAGAVVLPGTLVPSGQLWAGNPAAFVRNVTDEEVANFQKVCSTSLRYLYNISVIAVLWM